MTALKFLGKRKTIIATGVGEKLTTTSRVVSAVAVKALKSNTDNVLVSDSTIDGSGWPLEPGEAIAFACSDPTLVYVMGTLGDVVAYGFTTPTQ